MNKLQKANQLYSEKRFLEASSLYKQLSDEGNYGCSRRLGWMYFLGEGVDKDIDIASRYFKAAAENNDLEARFGLGKISLYLGDYDKAIEHYTISSNQGFSAATYRLGWIYLNSDKHFNKKKGIDYLLKAVSSGHIRAIRDLALLQIKSLNIIFGSMNYIKFIVRLLIVAVRDPKDHRLLF